MSILDKVRKRIELVNDKNSDYEAAWAKGRGEEWVDDVINRMTNVELLEMIDVVNDDS